MNNKITSIKVRKTILQMLYNSGASHLGSNMSAVEMLISIFLNLNCSEIKNKNSDRSRVIVSKGHCAAATYATMAHFGIFPSKLLESYHQDNSFLAGHVSHKVSCVEHSTGALGHGLNVAVGCALGLKSKNISSAKVFCLCGDGEIQEGSIWEAIMFAAHKKLDNLYILIDNNQISSITQTDKVINLKPLRARFEGFGLKTYEVDGHSIEDISSAMQEAENLDVPRVIICNTIKGKGVPFAEGNPIWHYRSLNDELYHDAINYLSDMEKGQYEDRGN